MSFTRRSLLATFGLALPVATVIAATEAEAATLAARKHKPKHHPVHHVAHKRHKPIAAAKPRQS